MPRGDQTGPNGMGPMTGRRAGFCAGFETPGYANSGAGYGGRFGRGMGRQFGRGFGRGNQWRDRGYYPDAYYAPPANWGYNYAQSPRIAREDETEQLRQQAEYLKSTLENIQTRLSELKKIDSKKKGD